ncbi:uncharacterized protein [Typha latifolia]|uniref:uncharacterized protein isoform X1 n=2 Tax=Typha latifolia TaxID=4733 RepID=UPI003C2C3998
MKTKTLKKRRSDEDRGENKKMKSKKRRRRSRRDSSCSSYSDDGSRSRKKISLRKKKSEKNKITSRKARYRSLSSSSGYSSRSCSTCSYSDRSRSPSRDKKVKLRRRGRNKKREKEKKERGRGRSRKRSRRSPSCSICEESGRSSSRGRSRSRSYSAEKHKARSDQQRQHKSSSANDAKVEDKIIQAYDDFPSSRNDEDYEEGRRANADHEEPEKKTGKEVEDGSPAENINGCGIDLVSEKSETVTNTDSSEAQDLELILRQKALENLKKFRGGPSAIKTPSSDQKDESVRTELAKPADGVVEARDTQLLQCNPTTTLQRQGSSQGGIHLTGPRIRSVVSIPEENENENSIIVRPLKASKIARSIDNYSDIGTTPNHVKKLERPNERTALQRTSAIPDKSYSAEHGNENICEADIEVSAEGLASDFAASDNTKNQNVPAVEETTSSQVEQVNKNGSVHVAENTTGSQFEQKTFSRMHDGEMVQVSYKVYIPKKSPRLARRQLQR